MSDVIRGKVVRETPDGMVLIEAPIVSRELQTRRRVREYWVQPIDSRTLSDKQRRTCYGLMGSIAEWMGEYPDSAKRLLKLDFQAHRIELIGDRLFSLASAPMSLVSEFQRYLVTFCIEHGVPTNIPLYEFADDIGDYIYQSLIHKKCAVCGRLAELHHVDRVGMGRDRTDICHEGMEALPLCRTHHAQAHELPDGEFMALYHFPGGVCLDKTLCKIWGLKAQRRNEGGHMHG